MRTDQTLGFTKEKFMKQTILFTGMVLLSANAFAATKGGCQFSDMAKLDEHLTSHVKYPITGKDLKAVCKKEWADEFTKEENDCADSKLKDSTKYKNAAAVKKALGL
jgi:hypothetical protein